jgi:hypothetical protein
MDLVSLALLSIFAAAAAGGALGFVVGRWSRFEIGLALGLLVFGAIAAAFAARLYLEYRDFAHAGANAAWGEVIAIEDEPANASGSITSPVPVIRFTGPDNVTHVIRGPSSGSAQVGSHVNVVYDPADPKRSRVGQVSELRGAAIALLLFGTFPLSFGCWLLFATALDARAQTPGRNLPRRAGSGPARAPAAAGTQGGRMRMPTLVVLNVGLACAILWIGLAPGDLQRNFVQGFSAIALLCAAYAVWGWAASNLAAAWSAGLLALSANFAVWAFALYQLL